MNCHSSVQCLRDLSDTSTERFAVLQALIELILKSQKSGTNIERMTETDHQDSGDVHAVLVGKPITNKCSVFWP